MGQPITWRNVDAPDLRGSAALMGVAQQGINRGFDQFQNVLQRQQQVDEANWNQVKENNTNELRNQLFAARTPEEAQAIQAQIMERMNTLGAQVDQNSIRTAMDGRIPLLQQRAKAEIDYNNAMTDAKDEPILKRLHAELLNDPINAVANLEGSGLSDRGRAAFMDQVRRITSENVQNDRGNVRFQFEKEDHKQKQEKFKDDLLTNAAQRGSAAAQAALAKAQAERITHEINKEKEPSTSEAQRALKDLVANGPMSAGTIDTKEGMAAVVEWVNKNVSGDAQKQDILYNVSKRAQEGIVIGKDESGKPIKAPIPAMKVIEAIMSSTENPLAMVVPGWSRRGDDMDNVLLQSMKDPELLSHIAAVEKARGNLTYPYLLKHAERVQKDGLKSSMPPQTKTSDVVLSNLEKRLKDPNTPEKEKKVIAKQLLNKLTGPEAWAEGPY